MPTINVDHPLLNELRAFDLEAAGRFSANFDPGLGQMGLLLQSRLEDGGYDCTPLNSLSFGGTGCDGVHFSFLIEENAVTEDSPVIVTAPADGYCSNVVAENLRDFLRTSLIGGFLVHESLSTYLGTGKNPSVSWKIPDQAVPIRDFLMERFNLTPLTYSLDELKAMDDRYQPKILYPPCD